MSKIFCLFFMFCFLRSDLRSSEVYKVLDGYEKAIAKLAEDIKSREKSVNRIFYLQSGLCLFLFLGVFYSCYKFYQFKKSVQYDDNE